MNKFSIHLENFTGPLDLLLYLISKSKIDIRDIFLSEITDQYISIVYSSESVDMESMGDFLSMAARLIEIKSKVLLPNSQNDQDLEQDKQLLIVQIEEYKKIKSILEELNELEKKSLLYYSKLPEESINPEPIIELKENTVASLSNAIFRTFDRKLLHKENISYKNKINSLRLEQISIKQGISNILSNISNVPKPFTYFVNKNDREYYATYFIAMLELLKQGKIICNQKGIFENIFISNGK